MKRIIIVAALALTLAPLLAQAEATSSVREGVLDRIRALKPEIKQDRKQVRIDIKKKIWDERVMFARERIGAIRVHITRLENVANRLQQVATRRESDGVSVSDARAKIASATASLSAAKTQLEGIIAQFPTEKTASTTPKATISAIQQSLSKVVTLIKSAHQDLIDAWQLLRTIQKQEKPTATSTATST